ncbi:MAG: hypothetical protein ACI9N1_002992 [Flavobacteriales bacterium]|jgi:hypothetical protein
MKSILPSIILFLLSACGYSQNCPSTNLTQSGDVQIIIKGPETGECFNFYIGKKLITSELTGELTFNVSSEDYRLNDSLVLLKGKVVMADGSEAKKSMNLLDGYKSHLFQVKKNKKGKYRLKREHSGMIPTEAKLAENQAEKEAFFDAHDKKVADAKKEREAESAADDAKWDADRAAEKKAMKESMASNEGAKLSEYKDTVKGVEGRKYEPIKEREEQLVEGRQYEPIKAGEEELVKGNDTKLIQGSEGQLVEGQSDTFGNQSATQESKSTFGKSAFEEEEETTTSNPKDIWNPNGETVKLQLRLLYNGAPVKDTYLTLEINNVKLGSGTTDAEGNINISTNLPVDMNTAFRLTGKKGDYSWMFGGIQLLDFPPKTTKVEMAFIINTVAEGMEVAPETLSKSWGFLIK